VTVQVGVDTDHLIIPANRIRMTNTRLVVIAELYCHASAGIHAIFGRNRNRPTKWAWNDQPRGRPTTPMKRRDRYATDGNPGPGWSYSCFM
jgi:hypothetical protein